MSGVVDAYHEWLGIPPGEQPPNHYRLLGVPLFEENPKVIENAADRQMAHLRTFQGGSRSLLSQQLLNEVSAARVCLLNPDKKAAYDAELCERFTPAVVAVEAVEPQNADLGWAGMLEGGDELVSTSSVGHRRKKRHSAAISLVLGSAGVVLALMVVGWVFWSGMDRGGRSGQKNLVVVRPTSSGESYKPHIGQRKVAMSNPGREVEPPSPPAGKATLSKPQKGPEPSPDSPSPSPSGREVKPAVEDEDVAGPPAPKEAPLERDKQAMPQRVATAEEKSPAKKFDPPSTDQQKRLAGEVNEACKVAEAKSQAAKITLAHKLLELGHQSPRGGAEQFVLFRRAGEIAAEAGEPDAMYEAVDAMEEAGFNIRPVRVKASLLKRLLADLAELDAARIPGIVAACVQFAEQAAAACAVDEAAEVLDAAREPLAEAKKRAQQGLRTAKTAALKVRSPAEKVARDKKAAEAEGEVEAVTSAMAAVAECAKWLPEARREQEAGQAAEERLKTRPDDPDACLAAGRWRCFCQGDWDEGLAFLARGSDAVLKSLAAKELGATPVKSQEKLDRADAWWDLAEKAAGRTKVAMRARAAHWYEESLSGLAGLAKSRAEKRLAEIAAESSHESGRTQVRVRPPTAAAPMDEKTAQKHQARWAKYVGVSVVRANSIGMMLTLIPPGEFDMGATQEALAEELRLQGSDSWYRLRLPGELPRHRVRITKPFYLGAAEVTQGQYQQVMGTNPSENKGDPNLPVGKLSWNDAVEFCRRLSLREGKEYRLPTEAQWEYACRAGTVSRWNCGNDLPTLEQCIWHKGNSTGKAHLAGQKRPNAWGLYDMQGNMWEWCADWYDDRYYAESPADDPQGPSSGRMRVLRGGSWWHPSYISRPGLREWREIGARNVDHGLRVARAP
jgi:formylglycine-generating enzyme required for sulfatase activity